MKQVFFLITLLVSEHLSAQIYLSEPSFENWAHSGNCPPPLLWFNCDQNNPANYPSPLYYQQPTDGDHFLGFMSLWYNNNYRMKIGQELNCSLAVDKQHHFAVDLSCMDYDLIDTSFHIYPPANLELWLGMDSCSMDTLIWLSPNIDTAWQRVDAYFTPDQAYTHILICPKSQASWNTILFVDNFSPIDISDTVSIQANNDTSIVAGNCVYLSATAFAAYDSLYWTSSDGSLSYNGLTPGLVCPTTATDYYVNLVNCSSCCWRSFDTVHVTMHGVGIENVKTFNKNIPTFITAENPLWHVNNLPSNTSLKLFDMTGREMYESKNYRNDFSFTDAPAGIYFYSIQFNNGNKLNGKILFIK